MVLLVILQVIPILFREEWIFFQHAQGLKIYILLKCFLSSWDVDVMCRVYSMTLLHRTLEWNFCVCNMPFIQRNKHTRLKKITKLWSILPKKFHNKSIIRSILFFCNFALGYLPRWILNLSTCTWRADFQV